MPTYSTLIPPTTFTTIIKGGKKFILNSVVKRNLNFSPKTKMSKHVVQPRPFPITILPKYTGGGRHVGEYDRQVLHQVHVRHGHAGQKIARRFFKKAVKRTSVLLWIIKIN
jgi:hypothetical protein